MEKYALILIDVFQTLKANIKSEQLKWTFTYMDTIEQR